MMSVLLAKDKKNIGDSVTFYIIPRYISVIKLRNMGKFIKGNWFEIFILVLNAFAAFTTNLEIDGREVYSLSNLLCSFWTGVYITILVNRLSKILLLND